MIGHVGAVVVNFPVLADRKMVRQDFAVHEDEAVLAEISVRRAIIDILDQVLVGAGCSLQKRREIGEAFDLFEIIPAMRACRTGQHGWRHGRAECRNRRIGGRREPPNLRDAATRYSLQQTRHGFTRGALDLARIVDRGLCETVHQLGRNRQFRICLIGVGQQIDDDIAFIPQHLGVVGAACDHWQRIDVVAGIFKKVLGWRVAAERRIERQHPEFGGRFAGRPPDQGPQSRRTRISRLRGFQFSRGLLDASNPVVAVGVIGIEGNRLLKAFDGLIRLAQIEVYLAEPVTDNGIVRPLGDQFEQKRLGDDVLTGGDQGLGKIAASRPMRGVKRNRAQIDGDGVLGPVHPEVRVAEIAPAGRQIGQDSQRGFVARNGQFGFAPDHPGIAQPEVQVRYFLRRGAGFVAGIETALVRGDGFIDPAGGVVFQPDAKLLRNTGVRKIGGGAAGRQ
jgi:hypothetical protein